MRFVLNDRLRAGAASFRLDRKRIELLRRSDVLEPLSIQKERNLQVWRDDGRRNRPIRFGSCGQELSKGRGQRGKRSTGERPQEPEEL